MHPLVSEYAAPAGGAALFLLSFDILCTFVVGYALVKLLKTIIPPMFQWAAHISGWLPVFGGTVKAKLDHIAQDVDHALGKVLLKIEAVIGWSWHLLSHEIRFMARELAGLAHLNFVITRFLVGLPTFPQVGRIARTAARPANVMARGAADVGHRADVRARAAQQSVAVGVMPRLRTAEGELDHVLEWDIPQLRARTRALERGAMKAFDWIKAHPKSIATTAFAGAVAIALGRLGGGWIRCRNWNRIGRHICGLPLGLIEDLLGLALAFLVVVKPRDIAEAAIKSEETMHEIIVKIAEAAD